MIFSSIYFRLRTQYTLNLFVWLSRYLLAFAFIPSGMKKVLGQRFTTIGIENNIGFFFEALYRSGMYWNFIGWSQVFAAFLLMTQRFASAGNLIYFFIIANIFSITISMHFDGTWVITLLMMLASASLLICDANKFQYIFYKEGFLTNNQLSLPEASRVWHYSGLLLFSLSMSYVLIDNAITSSHVTCLLLFFVAILMTVLATVVIELRTAKRK